MTITKFKNRAIVPPRGGWSYVVGGELVERHSEAEILNALRTYKQNNGQYSGEADLERELWDYYCSREPQRCGRGASTTSAAANIQSRILTPQIYGPWIWRMLNFEAVRFQREAFLHFTNRMLSLIDCPDCLQEWRDILNTDSPGGLQNAFAASTWVNRVHNRVNEKLGKATYPYSRGVIEYGFPTS